MDRNEKIKEHLKLALRPAEPPTLEEVLEQVSRHGVLRGPVDWVFPAWMLYVEYTTQKIVESFQLTEEEKRQLFHFRDSVKQLLQKTWVQTKEKLTTIYSALVEGRYRVEDKLTRIVVGDDIIHIYNQMYTLILKSPTSEVKEPHLITTEFPPLLHQDKTLRELQIGWIASDEGRNHIKPRMGTSQPWQLYAWVATRPGRLAMWVNHVSIVKNGISIGIVAEARDWTEYLDRISALAYVINEFKKGNWTPFTTAWLGDGGIVWGDIRRGNYRIRLSIGQKVAEKLRLKAHKNLVLLASGRYSYFKLWSAFPNDYRRLLMCLNSHKMRFLETIINDEKRIEYIKESDMGYVEICGIGLRIRIDLRNNMITLHKSSANIAMLEEIKRRLEECGIEAKIYLKKSSYTHLLEVKLDEQIVQKHPKVREKIMQYLETLPKDKRLHLLKKYPFLHTYLLSSGLNVYIHDMIYRISQCWASANRDVSLLTGTVLQVFPHRYNYSCEEVPADVVHRFCDAVNARLLMVRFNKIGKRGDRSEDCSLRSIDHSASWIRLKRSWKNTKST